MSNSSNLSNDCIVWPGRLDKDGYGVINVAGHKKAHRLIYTLFAGQIPPGLGILHSCDNPKCVNPAHLRPGTASDNARDRVVRGRSRRNGKAKLTAEAVQQIRNGMSCREACEKFGIRKSSYYCARNRQTYVDLGYLQPLATA